MRPLDPDLLPEWLRRRARKLARQSSPSRVPNSGERRAETRFPIANTEIRNHVAAARVVDFARGGMAIESTQSLRPGRRYTFTLTIGEHIETLEARILWCRLASTRRRADGEVVPVYRAGIERIRPSSESAEP